MSSRARSQSPCDSVDSFINNNIRAIRKNVEPTWNIKRITWWLKFQSNIQIPSSSRSDSVHTTRRRIQAIIGNTRTTQQEPTHRLNSPTDNLASSVDSQEQGTTQPSHPPSHQQTTGNPASHKRSTLYRSHLSWRHDDCIQGRIGNSESVGTPKPLEDPELDKILRISMADRRWPVPLQWIAAHTSPYVFNYVLTGKDTAVLHDIAALYPEGHPGLPPAQPIYECNELGFDHGNMMSYKNSLNNTHNKHSDVLQLSKAIYYLTPRLTCSQKPTRTG